MRRSRVRISVGPFWCLKYVFALFLFVLDKGTFRQFYLIKILVCLIDLSIETYSMLKEISFRSYQSDDINLQYKNLSRQTNFNLIC